MTFEYYVPNSTIERCIIFTSKKQLAIDTEKHTVNS